MYRCFFVSCQILAKNYNNAGATPSTKAGRPWVIVYTEVFDSKTEALKRENYLKRMKSRSFIENLIENSTQ